MSEGDGCGRGGGGGPQDGGGDGNWTAFRREVLLAAMDRTLTSSYDHLQQQWAACQREMDCLSPGGAAEAVRRGHSSPSSSDDLDWMTQSQFAQVVFHDVADCALLTALPADIRPGRDAVHHAQPWPLFEKRGSPLKVNTLCESCVLCLPTTSLLYF
jgi:hypothetical protein